MRWCHFPAFFLFVGGGFRRKKKKITSTIGHLKRHIMVSLSIFFGPFFGFKTVWEDEDVEGRKRNNTGVFF